MANPLSLIRKAGEVASRSKPFYSAVDEALSSLPNKALGEQMVKELLKKGVKPQEIIDRNLDAILGAPIVQKTRTVKLKKPDAKGRTEIEEKYFEVTPSQKGEKAISRADVERAAAENPAPQVGEDFLSSNSWYVSNPSGIIVQKNLSSSEAEKLAREIGGNYNLTGDEPKFAKYSIPGGENYREVLIRLPSKKATEQDKKRLLDIEQQIQKLQPIVDKQPIGITEERKMFSKLWEERDNLRKLVKGDLGFQQGHWEQPNVLAHARVSDRTGPNGEKILHVEEIQSDWHQKGRKEGYRTPKENVSEKQYDEYVKDLTNRYQERLANTYAGDETDPLKRSIMIPASLRNERDPSKIAETMGELDKLQDMFAAMYQERNAASKGVPDAPFKSTWHELVMKRLLDDAARNGYDRVVITPGKTQIDRYEDAFRKNIDSLEYEPYVNDQGKQMFEVSGIKNGQSVFNEEDVTPERLRELLGKDMHEKIMSGYGESLAAERPMRPDWKRISNEDISIGGEGMKGFYDQIIPSYLNKYGEKWGAKVQPYSYSMEGTQNPLHAFDITPQMREEIVGKGQPLYQVVPPAIGAGALMQEEEPGMKRGGAVNGDAMRMAVWNKQIQHKVDGKNIEHRQVGGAMRSIKAAANALKKIDVLPDAESKANLAKMLELSKTPMRLYHGTTATEGGKGQEAIKRFKPSKEGALGSGVYLTPNTAHASGYSGSPNDEAIAAMLGNKHYADTGLQFLRNQQTGNVLPGQEGGNMLPVYAQIKNPLILEGKGDPMIEALTKLGMDEDKATRMVERAYENKGYIGKEVETRARAVGYDGLMQYRDGNLSEVVVYNPNAIKSAIGNRGTYDLTDPDITKAKGGRIGNPDDKQFKAKQLRKKNA